MYLIAGAILILAIIAGVLLFGVSVLFEGVIGNSTLLILQYTYSILDKKLIGKMAFKKCFNYDLQ